MNINVINAYFSFHYVNTKKGGKQVTLDICNTYLILYNNM